MTLRRWLLERPFVVLDGGLATTLEAAGHSLDDALWSARLLRDDPGAILETHREFLRAGADCIVSATYQASLPGLEQVGLSHDEAEDVLRRSIDGAAGGEAIVAAGVGPFGAYLADGSEYTGDYGVGRRELIDFHQPRWEVLAASCDLLACETLPSFTELEVLLDLLRQGPGVDAWFSFSCRDEATICDGTPIADCAALCAESDQVLAVGINCTPPALIEPLIHQVREAAPGKPIVVYPNSGEAYDAGSGRWTGSAGRTLAAWAPRWLEAGARLIGGCCRTGPSDIRALRASLDAAVAS